VLDHLRDCRACRVKYEILLNVDTTLRRNEERLFPLALASLREIRAKIRGFRQVGRIPWVRQSASVGAIVVLFLAAFLILGKPGIENTLRGSDRASFKLMIPQGPVSAAPRLFYWTHVPQGDQYRFELIDDELQTLITLTTKDAWILIPESIQKKILSHRTYLWTIEAINDDNLRIAESRGYFELKPRDEPSQRQFPSE